ncbi:unnamed protein product [Moneuplotes crassus]|uniref:Uncharacterized protein n=1 Tax=Euplotes crassus TaxID=5936 RepID=A0AAD1Y580_EUPCR|nr:unnamed protein product [Moneuplotes crassus]
MSNLENLYEQSFSFKEELLQLKAQFEEEKEKAEAYNVKVEDLKKTMKQFEKEVKKVNKKVNKELYASTNMY